MIKLCSPGYLVQRKWQILLSGLVIQISLPPIGGDDTGAIGILLNMVSPPILSKRMDIQHGNTLMDILKNMRGTRLGISILSGSFQDVLSLIA